jgi:hypothetical protein
MPMLRAANGPTARETIPRIAGCTSSMNVQSVQFAVEGAPSPVTCFHASGTPLPSDAAFTRASIHRTSDFSGSSM